MSLILTNHPPVQASGGFTRASHSHFVSTYIAGCLARVNPPVADTGRRFVNIRLIHSCCSTSDLVAASDASGLLILFLSSVGRTSLSGMTVHLDNGKLLLISHSMALSTFETNWHENPPPVVM